MAKVSFDTLSLVRGKVLAGNLRRDGSRIGGGGSPINLEVSTSVLNALKKGTIHNGNGVATIVTSKDSKRMKGASTAVTILSINK